MRGSLAFNAVSGAAYTVPVFFYCSGFLQTLAFLQRDEETRFTLASLIFYYANKVCRYVPLNIMALLMVLFGLPLLASGPIWGNFQTLVAPCSTQWPTNIFWVNNLSPRDFDDKCLPWTWFVPCYVQLSLLIPPLVALAALGKLGQAVVAGLTLGALLLNLVVCFATDAGASVVQNEKFYARIFMSPVYHSTTFLMGVLCGLLYNEYLLERGRQAAGNSLTTRFFSLVRQNALPRYLMYLVGFGCMIGSVLWQMPFSAASTETSRIHRALYATFAFPIYIFGLSMLVLPALVGRAQLFRFFFGSQSWTMVSQMGVGLQYTVPMVALFYFMSTQHQIQVTYYMFLYYFTGNLVFGVVVYMVLLPTDRPIYAFRHL